MFLSKFVKQYRPVTWPSWTSQTSEFLGLILSVINLDWDCGMRKKQNSDLVWILGCLFVSLLKAQAQYHHAGQETWIDQ